MRQSDLFLQISDAATYVPSDIVILKITLSFLYVSTALPWFLRVCVCVCLIEVVM